MLVARVLCRMLIIVCIQLIYLYQVSLQGEDEQRLLDYILSPYRYNTLERPVTIESEPLTVTLGFALDQIIDVDEKNEILITRAWLSREWVDYNLVWNSSDYGNISKIHIHPHKIWRPDILMHNSADEAFDCTSPTNVLVQSNGSVTYINPGILKSSCNMDITWFPFDEQKCVIKFGSWTYDGARLDLQLKSDEGGYIGNYIRNGEWTLKGIPAKRSVSFDSCRSEPYVDITFVIHIQRRTLYYFFNLIVPFLLITTLAVLGFALPPDSREKLALGVTVLLSMTVYLNRVAAAMPATSDAVPLIGTYFNCMMFMVAGSVLSTIVTLNYHFRTPGTHVMSRSIRVLFLEWLPWFLRMSRPAQRTIHTEMLAKLQDKIQELELKDDLLTSEATRSHHELPLILDEIWFMRNKIQKDDMTSETMYEWKFVAMVIDRLCLIFFTLFTTIATIAFLISAPQIFEP